MKSAYTQAIWWSSPLPDWLPCLSLMKIPGLPTVVGKPGLVSFPLLGGVCLPFAVERLALVLRLASDQHAEVAEDTFIN